MKILILLLAPPLLLRIHTCAYAQIHTYTVPSLLQIPDSCQLGAQTARGRRGAGGGGGVGTVSADVGTEAQQASGNGTPCLTLPIGTAPLPFLFFCDVASDEIRLKSVFRLKSLNRSLKTGH